MQLSRRILAATAGRQGIPSMPVSYRIDHAAQRVVLTVTGRMDNDVINATYAQLFADADFVPGYDLLVDLSASQGAGSAIQMRERARRSGALKHLMSGRVALVCLTNDAHFGMARMYTVFAQEFGITAEAFTAWDAADHWLRTHPGRAKPLP
jgi:hypothetical protein